MTPEQWQERVSELFGRAVRLPVEEQAAFLDEACGDDAELRAEVASLLEHDRLAGADFLRPPELGPGETVRADGAGGSEDRQGSPGGGLAASADAPLGDGRPSEDQDASPGAGPPEDRGGLRAADSPRQRGSPLGADSSEEAGASPGAGHSAGAPSSLVIEGYEILRELHRGGQGVVYQAIQKSTKRKVAIKVLLEGPFASEKTKRRFEREIELVAQLKHPNIIAVFHSGDTEDGRQFCVMDYVRGVPLDQYVRREQLTLEETLKLFSTVCRAVNYAHQKGVIHRDLKPSNILVDSEGAPKVLDFGLAKRVGGPQPTLGPLTHHEAALSDTDPTATDFVAGVGDAVHIAGVGDVDGDGFGDMALGTPGRGGGFGAVFLVFGGNAPGYWPTDAVDLTPLTLRWYGSDGGLDSEQLAAGLDWNLSWLGALPPADASHRVVADSQGDDIVLTLYPARLGLPDRALPALTHALTEVRAWERQNGDTDLGRLLMLTLHEPWHYYAITGACADLDQWAERRGAADPDRYDVSLSQLASGGRRVWLPPEGAAVATLGFRVGTSDAPLDAHWSPVEFETVDLMANGRQRFAAWSAEGALLPTADPDVVPAGQPGNCDQAAARLLVVRRRTRSLLATAAMETSAETSPRSSQVAPVSLES